MAKKSSVLSDLRATGKPIGRRGWKLTPEILEEVEEVRAANLAPGATEYWSVQRLADVLLKRHAIPVGRSSLIDKIRDYINGTGGDW